MSIEIGFSCAFALTLVLFIYDSIYATHKLYISSSYKFVWFFVIHIIWSRIWIFISIFLVDDDKEEKKLSHRQKQRAARRAKKKKEIIEKKKALKEAKKNVAKQQEKTIEESDDEISGDENAKGNLKFRRWKLYKK